MEFLFNLKAYAESVASRCEMKLCNLIENWNAMWSGLRTNKDWASIVRDAVRTEA